MMPQDQEEINDVNQEPEPETVVTGEAGSQAAEPTLEAVQRQAEEYLASWQRTQADFINYKRRTEQERAEFNSFAKADVILSLLPVFDDLERALDSMPARLAGHEWGKGLRLIEQKFKTILEGHGVKPIKAQGEAFDPQFHEALRQDKGRDGIIIQEFQKGYLLADKVLRPSKVVVGNGEDEIKEDQ